MRKKLSVIVCGAGIGGLTVAHELAKRGFDVKVYERNNILGGLARSSDLKNKKKKYPTEYSWRVYGTGYKNLLRILGEIPLKRNSKKSVLDNLIKVSNYVFPRFDKEEVVIPKPGYHLKIIENFQSGDVRKIIDKTLFCMTMSINRMDSLDAIKWRDVCKDISLEAQKYMVQIWGPVLGMDTTYMSFPVVGRLIGVLLGGLMGSPDSFYLMKEPTNIGWFEEWSTFLKKKYDVKFKINHEVSDLKLKNGKIDYIIVKDKKGKIIKDKADYYICGLPVEVIAQLIEKNKDLNKMPVFHDIMKLGQIDKQIQLSIQIYLNKKLIYPTDKQFISYLPDTPWALIIEPEENVWGKTYSNDPRVKSVLSVGICQTDIPGILHKKPFTKCTPKEVEEEVWAQILKSYNSSNIKTEEGQPLSQDNEVLFYMWDSFKYDKNKKKIDVWEPKFSNNAGSFEKQPDATTPISNFYFAAGYTKTDRFIYSMESAAEAGVLASNAILKDSKYQKELIKIYPLNRTLPLLKPLVALDDLFFKLHLPHPSKFTFGSSIALVGLYGAVIIGVIAVILKKVF